MPRITSRQIRPQRRPNRDTIGRRGRLGPTSPEPRAPERDGRTGGNGRRTTTSLRRLAATILASVLLVAGLANVAGAHVTSTFDHLWSQHLAPLLQAPGTINQSTNPVDWTKLNGVPAGFADGLDNGVDRAGFGLKKNPVIGGGTEFAVDTTKIQRRMSASCGAGSAIQGVDQTGQVTCSRGPTVLYGSRADTGLICNDFCGEGYFEAPAGTWLVAARIEVAQWDPDESLLVTCRLVTEGQPAFDEAGLSTVGEPEWGIVSLLGVVTLPAAQTVFVACRDHAVGDSYGSHLSITATSVGNPVHVTVQGS